SSTCEVIVQEVEQQILTTDQAISSRSITDVKKRTDDTDEQQQQMLPMDPNYFRLDNLSYD
ncbi:unnamed protein product, partial [Rotaria magnacalcarata]